MNYSRPLEKRTRFAVISTLFMMLVMTNFSGCTKKGSSQNSTAAKTSRDAPPLPVPAALESLPPGFLFAVYSPSPEGFAQKWFQRVTSQGSGAWVEELEHLLVGPEGSGAEFLKGLSGPAVAALYRGPEGNTRPGVLVAIEGGNRQQLDAWVEWCFGSGSPQPVQPPLSGLNLASRPGALGPWFYGEASNTNRWLLSNDRNLLAKAVTPSDRRLPPGIAASWEAAATAELELFLCVHMGQVPVPQQGRDLLPRLGLDSVDALSIVVHQNEGRRQESLFIHSPEPHRGLFSMFNGPRLEAEQAAEVPTEACAFSVLSIDFRALWQSVQAMLPPGASTQLEMLERAWGLNLDEDLLRPLGASFASYQFPPDPEQGPPPVFTELALTDSERFLATLRKLKEKSPLPVLESTAPTGETLLSPPGAPGMDLPGIAIGEESLSFFSSSRMRDGWLAAADSKRGECEIARELFSRFGGQVTWLASMSAASLERSYQELSNLPDKLPRGLPPTFPELPRDLTDLPWEEFMRTLGAVALFVRPHPSGMEFAMESQAGILPGVLLVALGRAGTQRQNEGLTAHVEQLQADLARAQEAHHERYGRYALNLWELQQARLIDPEMARGVAGEFIFRVNSDGHDWHLEIRRDRDGVVLRLAENRQLVPVTRAASTR